MTSSSIPYGKQSIDQNDIEAVINVLKSDYLTQGPAVSDFERAFAEYIGVKYAVAVSNGTAALHLSVLSLGLNPGEKVITTPITFAASANCVRYAGGEVTFADVDPGSYLIDIDKIRELLSKSAKGTYKGIIPVDFAGRAVDLEKLRKLADEYGCWIIEDACHATGGWFEDSKGKKQYCGNCNYADLSIFSFHPVKHIAAGEGGMITTNNEKLFKKLLMLRTHGITKEAELMTENHGGWYYEMQELGYNYRLSDIHAALGNSQLRKAEKGLQRRREIAQRYDSEFSRFNEIEGQSGYIEGHAYHLYIIEVKDRLGLYNFLRDKGIYAQVHYIPVHLLPYYKQFGWKKGDLPNAESYYERCLSLPMFPGLTDEEQGYVIQSVKSFYE